MTLPRYRARSGSALSAISIGVLVAVIVMLAAASRYGNVLDYAGPNLASNELAIHANTPPPAGSTIITPNGQVQVQKASSSTKVETPPQLAAHAATIAKGLGAQLVALETPNASLNATQGGRSWDGQIYVATPQLLKAFGIKASEINPDADVLSSRPGLSGVSGMTFTYGSGNGSGPGSGPPSSSRCNAAADCLANLVIQELRALPTGTSAPNTVITEHAMEEFHIQGATTDWLVQGSQAFSASQISQRGACRFDDSARCRVEERPAHIVRRHHLGDSVWYRDRPRRARHVCGPDPERDRERPADSRRDGCE